MPTERDALPGRERHPHGCPDGPTPVPTVVASGSAGEVLAC